MKYLFLAYQDPGEWRAMSTRKRDAFLNACHASDQDLQDAGYLLARENLLEGDAVTVKMLNGEISIIESPPNQDLQLFEIIFINARDLNEAIRVASRMPQARTGLIQIKILPGI